MRTSALHLIKVFFLADFKVDKKYPTRILFSFFQIFLMIFLFYFISETLGEIPLLKSEYFPFVASGLAFQHFFSGVVNASSEKLEEYRDYGILEEILFSHYSPLIIMLSSGFKNILMSISKALIICFAFGFVFDVQLNLPIFLINLSLMFSLGMCLSIASSCSFLLWKRFSLLEIGGSVVTLFLSGIYFPTEVLPRPLETLSGLNPLLHGIGLFRKSLGIGGTYFSRYDTLYSYSVITISIVIMIILNLILYKTCLKRVKTMGISSHF